MTELTILKPAKTQCLRKKPYPTNSQATAAMRLCHGDNDRFNTYQCPHCKCWHVGHKPSEYSAEIEK